MRVTRAQIDLEEHDTLLNWIKKELLEVVTEMEHIRHGQTSLSNPSPVPSVLVPNTLQLKLDKKAKRGAKRATSQSVTGPVHSSKVSKPSKNGTSPHDRAQVRQRALLTKPHEDIEVEVLFQQLSNEPLRKSRRLAGLAPDSATSAASQYSFAPRRSVRIAGRLDKQQTLKPAPRVATLKQKSTRSLTRMNAEHSGRPQGISKSRNRKNAAKTRKIK